LGIGGGGIFFEVWDGILPQNPIFVLVNQKHFQTKRQSCVFFFFIWQKRRKPSAVSEMLNAMTRSIRYNTKDQAAFQAAVRKAIDNYFKITGQSTKGNLQMYLKIAFFAIWMIAAYVLLLLLVDTVAEVFIFYLLFGFGAMFFTINVAHDASHQALFKDRRLNKIFSHTWGLVGFSTYFWELKHHDSHHNFVNVIDYDADITPSPLLRLTPRTPYRWFHRYQHVYAFLLYAIFGPFSLIVREFRLLSIRQFGNTTVKHPPHTLLRLVLLKLTYVGWALVIPALVIPLPFWVVFAAFWVMLMASGMYAIIVLAVPHLNEEALFIEPNAEGVLHTNWYNHVLETTVDYAPKSRLLNWFSAGLNTHVLHHLFPNICHIHYYDLSPIIEDVAKAHGVAYHKMSFWAAIRGHFALVKALGRQESRMEHKVIIG
jgi:linoleoyl-CoA desaturase